MPKFESAPNINNPELNPNDMGADVNAGKKLECELTPEELEKLKIEEQKEAEKPELSPEEQLTHQPTSQELQPERKSTVGFLERGQTLEQVLGRDRKALEIMGYSVQEIADLLGPITEKAANGGNFEYAAPNGKQYEVKTQAWRGIQKCPWEDKVDGRKSSGGIDMYLTEKGKGGESVHIAGLIRHLVESHGFFEGGSFRVAPEKIVEMFGTERVPGSFEKVRELKF